MKNNYLISVFVDGRNFNSFYSENLDDLVTIKALYRKSEIEILDMNTFALFTQEHVQREIMSSGLRWKESLERAKKRVPEVKKPVLIKPTKVKPKKHWERTVMCVETGQVFSSIRECSEHTGIPYMTITNCIKNGNATRGVHFVNVPNPEVSLNTTENIERQ